MFSVTRRMVGGSVLMGTSAGRAGGAPGGGSTACGAAGGLGAAGRVRVIPPATAAVTAAPAPAPIKKSRRVIMGLSRSGSSSSDSGTAWPTRGSSSVAAILPSRELGVTCLLTATHASPNRLQRGWDHQPLLLQKRWYHPPRGGGWGAREGRITSRSYCRSAGIP